MNIEKDILPDNPAARLLSILERCTSAQFNPTEKVGVVLSRVFEVKNEPEYIFPCYSKLFVLIQDSYLKVTEYYPKQAKTHNQWKTQLSNSFKSHSPYHHNWDALIKSLKQGNHLDMVQIASDNLAHFVPATQIDNLNYESLMEQVSKLMEEIDASDNLSSYLKEYLKQELKILADYIKNFDLYGSEPIKKSMYNIISNIEVSNNLNKKVIKGVGTFLICVATAIGAVNDVNNLPKSIENLQSEFTIQQNKNTLEAPSVILSEVI
ncbi:hypothetical protein [Psychromonas sp. Urea-02u-13]|uniref:hypothetical protein n=1 Tax=Psychromonas sp. Urea-02u-13 TaxID=2058326 RepID=UPI000C338FF0|nr:hypothetical protein [Psychromonas sp. Urea-02u-13]PKG36952.1 hypothetical protein CXF74_21460 [Psychromonas sp. Urea-02u-13]